MQQYENDDESRSRDCRRGHFLFDEAEQSVTMELEEKKVLKNRARIFSALREKEWWYLLLYDKRQHLYFSLSFLRTYFADQFNFLCFDRKNNKRCSYEKTLFLDQSQRKGHLDLSANRRQFQVSFQQEDEDMYHFFFKDNNNEIELEVEESNLPPFTNRENMFTYHYTLLHIFNRRVRGEISLGNDRYEVDTDFSYYDHCFGKVPRKSIWHWLAVTNDTFSIASLINYGAYGQKYTQAFWDGRWHRLSEDVSFEYDIQAPGKRWKLTSRDVDLDIEIQEQYLKKVRIPPLLSLLVRMNHEEFMVRVNGIVRIDNDWIEVDDLIGVMEEHNGIW